MIISRIRIRDNVPDFDSQIFALSRVVFAIQAVLLVDVKEAVSGGWPGEPVSCAVFRVPGLPGDKSQHPA